MGQDKRQKAQGAGRRVIGPFALCLLLFALCLFLSTCAKVSEMSDVAKMTSVRIDAVSPSAVLLQAPEIEGKEVIIPLAFGKYLFPIEIDLAIQSSASAILGLEGGKRLRFEQLSDVKEIHLVAESGVAHAYTFKLREIPLNEGVNIEKFSLTKYEPSSFLLIKEPVYDWAESRIAFWGLGTSFPLSLHAEMTLSEGAGLGGESPQSPYTFQSYDSRFSLTVVAESGKERQWELLLKPVTKWDGESALEPDIQERLTLSLDMCQLISYSKGTEVKSLVVDPQRRVIEASIRIWEELPQLFLDLKPQPYTEVLGHEPEQAITISSWGLQKSLYIVDVLNGYASEWQVIVNKWLNDEAQVHDFVITSYYTPESEMRLFPVLVNEVAKQLVIPVEEGYDFPLTVSAYRMELSEGASANLPKELVFEDHRRNFSFEVTAENGSTQSWTLSLKPWFNTEAEIEAFKVLSYTSAASQMEIGEPVLHAQDSAIEIPVLKGMDFPLCLSAYEWQLSEYARAELPATPELMLTGFNEPLFFEIVAQSGDRKSWKIYASDQRIASDEAQLLSYTLLSYSGTSQTASQLVLAPEPVIDHEQHRIIFRVLDWAEKMPLHITARLRYSNKASVWPASLAAAQHEWVFNSLGEEQHFSITSESGLVTQDWTLALQNEATPKSSEKAVIDFISGAPSQGFVFAEKFLEPEKRQITLVVNKRPEVGSLIITPRLSLSAGARLLGLTSGASVVLDFNVPRSFSVQAQDESVAEWHIVLVNAPQIPNSDFESWGPANNSSMNLLPANGTGWTSANNSAVSGTTRVAGLHSGYAVQTATQLTSMNFVIFKITSITGGSIFLGKFTLKTGVSDVFDPIRMTEFGIPYTGPSIPVAFTIDYKYIRGKQLVRTEPKWGSVIPSFKDPVNMPGTDCASLKVEFFYHPSGSFNYVSARDNGEMVASGVYFEYGDVTDWQHLRVPITVVPGKEGLFPTHISVVLASSEHAQEFIGAAGSILTLDNFNLVYYQPEAGAKRLD